MWFKKKTIVPISNDVHEVESVQLWMVRWESRHGCFSGDVRDEVEGFASKEAANEFADSLRKAFKLIRHIGSDKITVKPN